ncbi:MAG: Type 1 glutamine amidotransferase-like domain-containing protein [Solirubrobacteraceae bacterium]
MRLFLASAELNHPSNHGELTRALAELATPVSRIAVVANARDGEPPEQRRHWVTSDLSSLDPLHADTVELDLRDLGDRPHAIDQALAGTDLIWVTGGDMDLLRERMRSSGLDTALQRRLAEDTIVYSGYSAGACLAGPALTTADLEGNPRAGDEIGWGGLGLVDFTIVPHLPPAGAADNDFVQIARHLRRRNLSHSALRDGQAIIVSGDVIRVI